MQPIDATYPSLKDRIVFVTGGGSGIGESIVEHFCRQGAKVTFVDIDPATSEALVARIAARGDRVPRFIKVDLRDVSPLEAAIVHTGNEDGPIKVLINNAGNDDRHRLDDLTPAYWDDRMAVNFRHQAFAIQAVRPQMRDSGGGSIVNLGSITWMVGDSDCIAYVTAKSAINGLTRWLARRARPGTHPRQLRDAWLGDDQAPARSLGDAGRRAPDRAKPKPSRPGLSAGRRAHGTVLAADDSRMCTSQNYIVDGGWV